MRARIRIHPEALDDIEGCMIRISQDNPSAALRFREAARMTFEMIARFPGAGAFHPALEPKALGLRRIVVPGFRSYIVVYRAMMGQGVVDVFRVVHTSRDIGAVLGIAE